MLFQKKIRTHVRRLTFFKEIFKSESSCTYCSEAKTAVKKIKSNKGIKHFFQSDSELLKIYPHIPSKYLRKNSVSEHFYLISPKIAKDIVKKIMPFLDLSGKQLIAETNAGLGLITLELLKEGVNLVRMFETCSEFRTELKVSLDVFNENCLESFIVFRILAKFIPIMWNFLQKIYFSLVDMQQLINMTD